MHERGIKVMTMDSVWPGMHVAEPDSDEWGVGDLVDPLAYDPEEQDWHHVRARTGHVDLPTYTLAYHSGEEYTAKFQTTATVWVLVEASGPAGEWRPVEQEVERT